MSQGLKKFAKKFGLDINVYTDSFRHLYAKNFLEKFNDIYFGGHYGYESIVTKDLFKKNFLTSQSKNNRF
ncbi:hypothetical protein HYE26_02970 [Mycoplasmopsis bovis]|nr:hypothetical protein HYE26_02970 [Mycoplasmopsis bovis]